MARRRKEEHSASVQLEAQKARAARVYEKYGVRASLYQMPGNPLFDETRLAAEARVVRKGAPQTKRGKSKRYWSNVRAKAEDHAKTKYRLGKPKADKAGIVMTCDPIPGLEQAPTTTLACRCGNRASIPAVGGLTFRCSCGQHYQT